MFGGPDSGGSSLGFSPVQLSRSTPLCGVLVVLDGNLGETKAAKVDPRCPKPAGQQGQPYWSTNFMCILITYDR